MEKIKNCHRIKNPIAEVHDETYAKKVHVAYYIFFFRRFWVKECLKSFRNHFHQKKVYLYRSMRQFLTSPPTVASFPRLTTCPTLEHFLVLFFCALLLDRFLDRERKSRGLSNSETSFGAARLSTSKNTDLAPATAQYPSETADARKEASISPDTDRTSSTATTSRDRNDVPPRAAPSAARKSDGGRTRDSYDPLSPTQGGAKGASGGRGEGGRGEGGGVGNIKDVAGEHDETHDDSVRKTFGLGKSGFPRDRDGNILGLGVAGADGSSPGTTPEGEKSRQNSRRFDVANENDGNSSPGTTPDEGAKMRQNSRRFDVANQNREGDPGGNSDATETSRHAVTEPGVAQQRAYRDGSTPGVPKALLVDAGKEGTGDDGAGAGAGRFAGGRDDGYESMDFEEDGLEELLIS